MDGELVASFLNSMCDWSLRNYLHDINKELGEGSSKRLKLIV